MEKSAAIKEKLEQAEVKYSKHLKTKITSLPSLNQMPGNFGRQFIKADNRNAVLDPLPDCEAKTKFSQIISLWENIPWFSKCTGAWLCPDSGRRGLGSSLKDR